MNGPRFRLPLLPPEVVPLDGEDADRVTKELDGRFSTPQDCPTCGGSKQFRWYTHAGLEVDGPCSRGVMSPVPVDRLISALPATEIGWFDCPCEDQWESLRYMMGAGVGLHDQKLSLSDLVSDEPRQALWRYSEHFKEYIRAGTGMLMYGSNGNGKTMAAVLLAKDLLSQGVKAYFTTYAQLIQTAFASYQSEEAKEWYYQKVRGAHLLVIDDVGKELRMGMQRDISNVAVHLIDDVLRHRYSTGLPTVVTTNELLVGLTAGYGSGVLSLMSENMITFNFTGGDWRTKARARFDAEVDQGLTRPIVFR